MNQLSERRVSRVASILLRIGIAFVFLYAAVASFVEPDIWVAYLPTFIQSASILVAFSVIEILLALWLLWGKWTRYAALLAALMFAGIIITNLSLLDIVFRDVAIFFSALALAVMG